MLKYMCLDKIIDFTREIKDPCEDTLKWVLEWWTYIKKLSPLEKDYCNNGLCRRSSEMDVSVALCTFNHQLRIVIYKKNGDFFIDLKKKVYETLMKNEDLKNFYTYGINGIIFCYIDYKKVLRADEERINFKTFLLTCKSIKSISLYDIFLYRTYQNLRNIDVFCNYLLGIDLLTIRKNLYYLEIIGKHYHKDRTTKLNVIIKELKYVIQSSDPLLPKLMNMEFFFNSIPLLRVLPYFILKNLRSLNSDEIGPINLGSIFFRDEMFECITKPSLQNRIETITCEQLEFCLKHNLLTESFTIFFNSVDIINRMNSETLKILKDYCDSSKKKLLKGVFDLELRDKCYLTKQILDKNPDLCKLISVLQFNVYNLNIDSIETLINFVTNAPRLEVLRMHIFSRYGGIKNINHSSIICPTVIKHLVIIYDSCVYSANQYYFKNLLFIENLTLVFNTYSDFSKSSPYSPSIEVLPDLKCLKTINVSISNTGVNVPENLISFLINVAQIAKGHTRLTYSALDIYSDFSFHAILRFIGWIPVAYFNVIANEPYINEYRCC